MFSKSKRILRKKDLGIVLTLAGVVSAGAAILLSVLKSEKLNKENTELAREVAI